MILLLVLILFPSVTFGIVNAEIFPWAVLSFVIFGKSIPKGVFWILIILLINTISSSIFFGTFSEGLRSFFAYINAILAFCVSYKLSRESSLKFYKYFRVMFLALLLLGVFQYFGLVSWLDEFVKILIPRGSMLARTEGNRGISLLSTEPARAGSTLILMYGFLVHDVDARRKKFYDVFMLIYLLVFIQSSMALILFVMYLFLTYRFYTLFVLPGFAVLYIIMNIYNVKGRSLLMIEDLLLTSSWSDAFYLLVSTSGNRAISIYASWKYACTNFMGGGIGNWYNSSLVALKSTNYDFSTIPYYVFFGNGNAIPSRMSGFFSNILLDTGLVGFIVFILVFCSLLRKSARKMTSNSKVLLLLIFLKLLFFGSPGHPLPWFLVGSILNRTSIIKPRLVSRI